MVISKDGWFEVAYRYMAFPLHLDSIQIFNDLNFLFELTYMYQWTFGRSLQCQKQLWAYFLM